MIQFINTRFRKSTQPFPGTTLLFFHINTESYSLWKLKVFCPLQWLPSESQLSKYRRGIRVTELINVLTIVISHMPILVHNCSKLLAILYFTVKQNNTHCWSVLWIFKQSMFTSQYSVYSLNFCDRLVSSSIRDRSSWVEIIKV